MSKPSLEAILADFAPEQASLLPICHEVQAAFGCVDAAAEAAIATPIAGTTRDVLTRPVAIAGVPFLFKQWGEWMPGDTNDETVSLTFPAGMPCGPDNPEWHKWPDGVHSARVGKKAAGRLLDGRPWDEFPITA